MLGREDGAQALAHEELQLPRLLRQRLPRRLLQHLLLDGAHHKVVELLLLLPLEAHRLRFAHVGTRRYIALEHERREVDHEPKPGHAALHELGHQRRPQAMTLDRRR